MSPDLALQPILKRIPSSAEEIPVIGMGTWQTFMVDDTEERLAQMETSLAELRRPNIELMQLHSLGERASGERILPMARERDIGVITARPFAGGNLFQATRGPATSNPDHMRDNMGAGVGRLPDAEMRRQMEAFMDAL